MCKWIPVKHSDICGTDVIVSELPRDGEPVFVTVEGTKVLFDTFLHLPDRRKDFICFGEKVEAWMRFPKPYNPNDRSSLWNPIEHDPLWCLLLPDDGERVLITVGEDLVLFDTFRVGKDGTMNFDRTPIGSVTAWMKFPIPYVPRICRDCRYCETLFDQFGDGWMYCTLLTEGVFPNTKPVDCPLKRR